MPVMDWEIVNSRGVIWSAYEEEDSSQLIVPLSLTAALAQTSFAERYRKEVMMAYLDSLNMIYVALTRAEEVFWALAETHSSKGDGVLNKLSYNIQMALQSAIGQNEQMDLSKHYDHENEILDIGTWPDAIKIPTVLPDPPKLSWSYRNWSSLLQVRKYTEGLSEEKAALQAKRNYGVVVHRILEKLKDVEELEVLLHEAYFDGQFDLKEMEEVKRLLSELFEHRIMQGWFAKGAHVLTEQGILLPGGSSKRPDRTVIGKERVAVIDL